MREIVIKSLTDFFTRTNFKKTGQIWYKEANQILILAEYEGSRFNNGFYLNLGVYYKAIGKSTSKVPKSGDWHFKCRYMKAMDGMQQNVKYNTEFNLTDDNILSALEEMKYNIESFVLPQLEDLANVNHMKKVFPDDFDRTKWWLSNITGKELIQYLETTTT